MYNLVKFVRKNHLYLVKYVTEYHLDISFIIF